MLGKETQKNPDVVIRIHISCAMSLADWNLALVSLADRDVISFTSLRLNFLIYHLIDILTFHDACLFSFPSHFSPHIHLFHCMHEHTHRPKQHTLIRTSMPSTRMAHILCYSSLFLAFILPPSESSSFVILLFHPFVLWPRPRLPGDS